MNRLLACLYLPVTVDVNPFFSFQYSVYLNVNVGQ